MAAPQPTPTNPRFQDLTKWRPFGRLTVLFYAGKRGRRHYWHCRCVCDNELTVSAGNLKAGGVRSCGCLATDSLRARSTKHGHASPGRETKEYRSWNCMINRCHNPALKDFVRYGWRGIKVCLRWRESFAAFFADVGPAPSPKHTLDRFPNQNGDYSPGNVRWATAKQQARNRRNNHLITCHGLTLTISEWAERTGIGKATIRARLERGWSDERAVTAPKRHQSSRSA